MRVPCASACPASRVCVASGRSRHPPRSITSSPESAGSGELIGGPQALAPAGEANHRERGQVDAALGRIGGKYVLSARVIHATGSPWRCT